MQPNHKVFIAGARGMVGSALHRLFREKGFERVYTPTREELDLTDQRAVQEYMQQVRPDCVIIAAARVGGIYANMTYPAEFLYDNLMIEANLIHASHLANVERLLFLGSTCIYPREAEQPIKEEALLTSALEPTNEAYALAKIAGIKLTTFYHQQYGRDYISAMPTNLYGPGDNYHPTHSHVIPGLIRRFHKAKGEKSVEMWGSGKVYREFLFVDDLAEACYFLLENYHAPEHINVGSDEEFQLKEVAEMVAKTVGFEGEITHDLTKPDGTPRKKSDLTIIHALGWRARTSFLEGLKVSYQDFLERTEQVAFSGSF